MNLAKSEIDKKIFEEIKLVVFYLPGDDSRVRFGLNAHKVREVVEVETFDKLPPVYQPYVGIINLRGVPIPILNMQSVLGDYNKSESLIDGKKRIIVCETLGKLVGVIACQNVKMFEFEDRCISKTDFAQGNIDSEYISGIIDHKDGYIFMLNIETVLDQLDGDNNHQSKTITAIYKGKRALIVEDSQLYQKKLSRFLQELGFEVSIEEDGQKGLDHLMKNHNFDIIFSDIEMPVMNGIEMVRRVKEDHEISHIPVVFHSSISNEEIINRISHEKLGKYLVKFEESIILEALREIF